MPAKDVIKLIDRIVRDRRGATGVMAALLAPAVIGFAALGAEVGYWYSRERTLQGAAEAAAYSAAVDLLRGGDVSSMTSTASAVAGQGGYDAGKGSLAVANPAGFGSDVSANAVSVTITETATRMLTGLFLDKDVTITVRAAAAVQGDSEACVLALSQNASGAVTMSGNSSIELSGCSIMSNSSASDAFDAGGSSDVETPCVAANGGVQGESHLDLTECSAPRENVPRASDPYADVAEPNADAMPCLPAAVFGGGSGATYTAAPGRYCGGMDIRRTVDFLPGTYVIDGGELRINSSATVTGTGVTFYLRNGAELNINGAATIQLDAPTSGATAGLVFFGARDNNASHTLNGGAGTQYTGALYFPDDHVRHNGGHDSANGCIQLIADTIDFRGDAGFSADCSGTGVRSVKIPGRVRLTG